MSVSTISFTICINIYFIKNFQFLYLFKPKFHYKLSKEYILPNILNSLASINTNIFFLNLKYLKLDTLFIYNAI